MGDKKLSIAIVGAGIGGLAAAATLRQVGIDVRVYEQAPAFARVGVEEKVRDTSFVPFSHFNREGETGKVMRELPMPESLFGAPYLCMHRAELHKAFAAVVPEDIVHLNKKLVGLEQREGRVTLAFADETRAGRCRGGCRWRSFHRA
jgi:2-polyprenyl-6-methoxyphenol hydroxylase-like FAD-dependent oxidoreductase